MFQWAIASRHLQPFMETAQAQSNLTTGILNNEPEDPNAVTNDDITIGTVVAIVMFILIVGFYSYKLQSPANRRRFASRFERYSEHSRRNIGNGSEIRRDVLLERFDVPFTLPSYESVMRLEVDPPPYEYPPSYEEAVSYIAQDIRTV